MVQVKDIKYITTAAQSTTKHLRLKSRIAEKIRPNNSEKYLFAAMLYTVKVQVKILGIWVTVWAKTCDFSDGDARPIIKKNAEEVHQALTNKIHYHGKSNKRTYNAGTFDRCYMLATLFR